MACSSHQSRNAKALRWYRANGLAGVTYSFMMTAIAPVNTADAYTNELISPLQRARRRVRIAAVCAQADA
jgi:hypothetical protein